jgi:hypothetical protein
MGLQRAHAKLLGEGEGLSVVGFGFLDRWGLAVHGDLGEEPQGPCLGAAFLAAARERQGTFGELERVIEMANPEVGLAQSEHLRTASHAGRFPYLPLIEQR